MGVHAGKRTIVDTVVCCTLFALVVGNTGAAINMS